MGERLNIEIVGKYGTFFNTYYHWSAYTESALDLTLKAVKEFNNMIKDITNRTPQEDIALDMLLATGARMPEFEFNTYENYKKALTKDHGTLDIFYLPKFKPRKFDGNFTRADGMISCTSFGIRETRSWVQSSVLIDIDQKTINFGAFMPMQWLEYESLEERLNNTDGKYDYLNENFVYVDWDLERIPFSEFEKFSIELKEIMKKSKYLQLIVSNATGKKYAPLC